MTETEISAAFVTSFPSDSWDIYSKRMLESFVQYMPPETPLCIALDNDLLLHQVESRLRPQDAVAIGWTKDHRDFVERNKAKDDPQNYRKQVTRFCHKVFAISRAYDAVLSQKKDGGQAPRYLIWMDADVLITRRVKVDELRLCLPKEGDQLATNQRKDWNHSECGWLAFDLENGGGDIIVEMFKTYISDAVLKYEEWHDSFIFDKIAKKVTNLTPNAPGLDVWQYSPMGKWSQHFKGPKAKADLAMQQRPIPLGTMNGQNVVIQTKNAIPHEEIRAQIAENQKLIKNWIKPCEKHDETVIIASAGPSLVAEHLRGQNHKIVVVKHAIKELKRAGIKPWATILLDPRPHVADFIDDPDTDVIWFVASQVNPKVTMKLLAHGCNVWGYHAAVGADEQSLTEKQPYAVISGGSATATRGMFVLNHLGFSRFKLYGYDLSFPDKPDLQAIDDKGQPKYLEMSMQFNDKYVKAKKCFWTEPQLLAQFEELNDLVKAEKFELEAFGDGMIPFIVNNKKLADLRNREIAVKIMGDKYPTYEELLCSKKSPKWWRRILRKPLKETSF